MKKLIFILTISFVLSTYLIEAQNCNDFFAFRYPTTSYTLDTQSISGLCNSDSIYRYSFKLEVDKEYRISFFASAVFNANMDFKIYNSTNRCIFDLQGDADETINKPVALREFYDGFNMVYPYFVLQPTSTEIYVLEIKTKKMVYNKSVYDELGNKTTIKAYYDVTGCITFYLQYKYIQHTGFSK